MSATLIHPHNAPRLQPMALATIVLAHVGVLWAWSATRGPEQTPPEPLTMVSVVTSPAPVARAEAKAVQAPAKPAKAEPKAQTSTRPAPVPKAAPASVKPVLTSTAEAPAQAPAPAEKSTTATTKPSATPSATPTSVAANNSVSAGGSYNGAPAVPVAAPITAPRFDAAYLDNPAPAYPPLSRKANEQGKVVLQVWVDAQGLAKQVEVRTSSGYERLDRAASTAVSRWKFVPARQGSEAVAATVLVPIVFSFKD